ncbi:NAD(P)/FAD-dependent oxidoreductase [Adlercreutzia sp. R21]|uniref:NAD(P)/FAD-dependent oxidoreductase n=1 Tax=Adlercreutzia wanghongyangiae TaxID=3111451 RepID=UPI002DBBC8DD|nr:NAD(P)/FAD-dependent oxidoreductase [Adlercreutzia sp. R21]MEC4185019.1 NAD(P)/FAD-dependent oxidoreductase [Adlercreutzia sp. R21]
MEAPRGAEGSGGRGVEGAASAARVVVYEVSDRVGRSILATGNGRCNFSNARPGDGDYRNGPFVEAALAALEEVLGRQPVGCGGVLAAEGASNAVLGFFADHGLMWREEGEGRLYPLANKATSVLDCLRAACAAAGVEERVECEVAAVQPPREAGGRFTLRLADGRFERADAVIAAVGGSIARGLLPEGVPFRELEPTLGPLATEPRWPRRLDNIRVRGALELWRPGEETSPEERNCYGLPLGTHEGERLVSREVGEVMFRKYGVSGIAAFNLSRLAESGDVLAVDFVPRIRLCDMEAFLNRRRKLLRASLGREATWDDMLRGMVLAPVADVLLEAAALNGARPVAKGETARMATFLKGLRLPATGLGDPRQCQVHRGGVEVDAVDELTCELREVPGLYVVGEALDVDAACGGYNLHWAWASGLLAGWSTAERLAGSSGSARGEER